MICVNIMLIGIFLNTIQDSSGERRITGGKPVTTSKRYMSYLLKAPPSSRAYDAWLCGGAIVSPLFIVTSAACIEDVEFMYAIAGYGTYINFADINTDPCTKKMRKKVILTCVPRAYTLHYDKVHKWSSVDIGVVKVESPFDYADKSYEEFCSYMPNQIRINFDNKYQRSGTDAIVMGWGHIEIWRDLSDPIDYNQAKLQYATTQIVDKKVCRVAYENVDGMDEVIDNFMICTFRTGNLDDTGEYVNMNSSKPLATGCNLTMEEEDCVEYPPMKGDTLYLRNQGICQNDHGGPLVSWVGTHEVLLGVASVFRVSEDSKCIGPYLFTSTQCNGAFLDCIINGEQPEGRREICDKPPEERGFEIIRRAISWKNHPDGPAANEKLRFRPVLPIRSG